MMGVSGLDRALSAAQPPDSSSALVHDPAKVVFDLASALAPGSDCAADIAMVRSQPELCGQVASDPTVSRLISTLAGDVEPALAAIRAARARTRQREWQRRLPIGGGPGSQVIIAVDATLVSAHSDKELAAPTFKGSFGFHPLFRFCDQGAQGSGETWPRCCRPARSPLTTPLI
jgi:Transposase DDE domain group 1